MKSIAAVSMKLAEMRERTMMAAPRMAVEEKPIFSPNKGTNMAEIRYIVCEDKMWRYGDH